MDPRSQLTARLSTELDDPDGARSVVAAMDDAAVAAAEALADGDIAGSPWLSYRPSTVPVDEIDSLWVFSYGFRFADPAADPVGLGARVPGPDELVPGPTNEALARAAADVVVDHPVPVVAQWEVARELQKLGVADVISVEPDTAPDGSVVYLSTAGVADKGLRRGHGAGSGRRPVLPLPRRTMRAHRPRRRVDRGRPRGGGPAVEVRPEVGSGLDAVPRDVDPRRPGRPNRPQGGLTLPSDQNWGRNRQVASIPTPVLMAERVTRIELAYSAWEADQRGCADQSVRVIGLVRPYFACHAVSLRRP